jgi:hypothetical protein
MPHRISSFGAVISDRVGDGEKTRGRVSGPSRIII